MHLDLNLLTALDALLEEGSVAGAAARLHLTQPAMSRALGRIRRAMGDEILVRTGRTMTPTPRALAVQAQVHTLVQQAQTVLTPDRTLDLTTLDRTFTLRWHDAVTTAAAPGLLARISAQAPGVRLSLLPEAGADTTDLRHGHVDLEITAATPESPDLAHETIAHDRLVVLMRENHPAATRNLTPARYAKAAHLIVSRRGQLADPVDDLLAEHGLHRQVRAAVPTTAAALQCLRDNDFLVVLPEHMTRAATQESGLLTRPLPFPAAPIPVIMAWHQRYTGDPAHTWLRTQTRTTVTELCADPTR
ncbi:MULTISPECIES: LysR family transcriptional regulator [unclassified Crossiella]|uniref:LysR family transcriptional regulator n=1 Tax=unclassified Crossiella TaxID=2620835 RepID=UPI00200056F7|nr:MULTISPECIES: LysR family transcriptional regulator [unclassified Crossiella]MCK2241357.1 LysR family transcriptional regulator [Crossiella sp. S99.2]MCK2253499.1 LysR family transcriptional regulator [Crossiella sp. S99.1]